MPLTEVLQATLNDMVADRNALDADIRSLRQFIATLRNGQQQAEPVKRRRRSRRPSGQIKTEILEAVQAPMGVNQVAEAIGGHRETVRKHMNELAAQGRLTREGSSYRPLEDAQGLAVDPTV